MKQDHNGNYIKLFRCLLDWEWYENSTMVHLFIHLLLNASWKDNKFLGQEVRRGQLITGRKRLSVETGINESTITRCLKRLEKSGEITQKANNKNRLITICNYEKYQTLDSESEQQKNNKRTTNEQQTNTTKEGKEGKEYNCLHYVKTAERLIEVVRLRRSISADGKTVSTWSDIIRKMVERDKIPHDHITRAIEWYAENWDADEYVPVIESARSLREKWGKLLHAGKRLKTETRSCDKCRYKVIEKMNCWQEGRTECKSYSPV